MMNNNIFSALLAVCLSFAILPAAAQSDCEHFEHEVFGQVQDCANGKYTYCAPVELADVINEVATITVNGVPFNSDDALGCDRMDVAVYHIAFMGLIGQGHSSSSHKYILQSWEVNGISYSCEFSDITELVVYMNEWDPSGNWYINPNNVDVIVGGSDPDNVYSNMMIDMSNFNHPLTELTLSAGPTPMGVQVFLPEGLHHVTITQNEGNCSETVAVNVTCTKVSHIQETAYVGLPGSYCLDVSELPGDDYSLFACGENSGNNIRIDDQSEDFCFSFTAMKLGNQTNCHVICDNYGVCDTTYVTVNVVTPPAGEVVVATIPVGEVGSECLSADALEGSDFTIMNDCPEDGAGHAKFVLADGSLCVEYVGLSEGLGSACIVIGDELGNLDTVMFYISVFEPVITPPTTEPDTASTKQNEHCVISVLDNDAAEFSGDFTILNPPANGSIYVTEGYQVVYEPEEGFCGSDHFEYIISNETGSDTAIVFINIDCEDVKVYTGFSPNGDGVNDQLRISGIEAYPKSSVQVYNSWGNLVYDSGKGKGYDNNNGWDGTWNGKHLPDGNYFYVISLGDGQEKMTGHILIYR